MVQLAGPCGRDGRDQVAEGSSDGLFQRLPLLPAGGRVGLVRLAWRPGERHADVEGADGPGAEAVLAADAHDAALRRPHERNDGGQGREVGGVVEGRSRLVEVQVEDEDLVRSPRVLEGHPDVQVVDH
jgi:hypothetical protein